MQGICISIICISKLAMDSPLPVGLHAKIDHFQTFLTRTVWLSGIYVFLSSACQMKFNSEISPLKRIWLQLIKKLASKDSSADWIRGVCLICCSHVAEWRHPLDGISLMVQSYVNKLWFTFSMWDPLPFVPSQWPVLIAPAGPRTLYFSLFLCVNTQRSHIAWVSIWTSMVGYTTLFEGRRAVRVLRWHVSACLAVCLSICHRELHRAQQPPASTPNASAPAESSTRVERRSWQRSPKNGTSHPVMGLN